MALATVVAAGCSTGAQERSASSAPGDGGEAVRIVRNCDPVRPDSAPVYLTENVPYSAFDGEPLRFDIARPSVGGPHPLVVLLHGGGWSGGSKESMRHQMLELADRGYAAASVDYRLTQAPHNVFPAAVRDVRCALRRLRASARDYDIDSTRVAAVGFSAGGHLAAMLGVAADVRAIDGECARGDSPVRVSAVISYAGPQDLQVNGPYTDEQARLVTNFLGAFPGDDPALAAIASPITHVTADDPPFLLVHGTRDELVPVEQSWRMAAALRGAGVPATVLELRGMAHSFVGFGPSERPQVGCTALAFLDRWLRDGPR